MADIFDQAQDHIERELEQRIQRARRLADAKPVVVDKCRNCWEPITAGLYCDSACRNDFEQRDRAERRSGLK